MWVVFEGDKPITDLTQVLPWGGDINRDIAFPITLRVFRLTGEPGTDSYFTGVDIEVDENFVVTEKRDVSIP